MFRKPLGLLGALLPLSALALPSNVTSPFEKRATVKSKSLFRLSVLAVEFDADGNVVDVIIQLFEWTWDSVAAECTNFIGPAGEITHALLWKLGF
jgi:hypothetical protein